MCVHHFHSEEVESTYSLQALACFKILPNSEIFPVFVSLPCVDN